MRRRFRIGLLLILAAMIGVSWFWALVFGEMAKIPLGLCPILVLSATSATGVSGVAAIIVVGLIYLWSAASIWGISKRSRWATVSLVVLLTLDLAANIVFTVTTWWYLLAAALDLLFLLLGYLLYRISDKP